MVSFLFIASANLTTFINETQIYTRCFAIALLTPIVLINLGEIIRRKDYKIVEESLAEEGESDFQPMLGFCR